MSERVLAWRKRWEVLERRVGEELLLLADVLGSHRAYVMVEPAGQLIWKSVAEARTGEGLGALLSRARGHTVPEENDVRDAEAFVAALSNAGLIARTEADSSAVDPPFLLDEIEARREGMSLPPNLVALNLDELSPSGLKLNAASGGFHASGHSHPGMGC